MARPWRAHGALWRAQFSYDVTPHHISPDSHFAFRTFRMHVLRFNSGDRNHGSSETQVAVHLPAIVQMEREAPKNATKVAAFG